MRAPFRRSVLLRPLRRARARRYATGLGAPIAVAVALAVAGHAATSGAAVAITAVGSAPEAAHAPRAVAGGVLDSRVVQRASRSGTRHALVAPRWVRPAHGPFTSPFGYRWGKLHKGIDIGAPYGSPIYAAAAGTVVFVGPMGGYGRLVKIQHEHGVVTAYGHMSRFATHVGAHVKAGDVIAYVGSEGHSTGPHLHFEVYVHGVVINPLPFLHARGVFFS